MYLKRSFEHYSWTSETIFIWHKSLQRFNKWLISTITFILLFPCILQHIVINNVKTLNINTPLLSKSTMIIIFYLEKQRTKPVLTWDPNCSECCAPEVGSQSPFTFLVGTSGRSFNLPSTPWWPVGATSVFKTPSAAIMFPLPTHTKSFQ